MKILIAGFGSIGRRHFHNLKSLGQNDFIFYRSHLGAFDDSELAGYPVETDLQHALAFRPDAVIVANPTAKHLDVAIPAAEAGCHIFMEKPLSHSMQGIDRLQSSLQRGGGQFMTGFQFRFHPGLQAIKDLLEEHTIGRIVSVHAHWGEYLPGWHPWEDYRQGYSARADLGGGVTLTLCHPLDYLRWLLGEADQLWAMTGKLSNLDISVEDTAQIGLRFANGALGTVHLDYIQRPPAHWLEIIGEEGVIRWDNANGDVQVYQVKTGSWQTKSLAPGFERNDLFRLQMAHFLDVIKGECQPLCTLDDGIQALRLVLAVHQSQASGKLIHL